MKEAMQNRMKRALAAALAFITLLLPCFAWIPQYPAIFHATRPPTTNTKLAAYLDDDSSSPALPSVTNRNGRQQHEQSSTPEDYTGAGTLGDIMSKETTNNTISGLVTTDGGLLHERFGISSPLDRMALTANGNLQRLFSSYYDAPVHVVVDSCELVEDDDKTWNRVVHLTVHSTTFCTAKSRITLYDSKCRQLVESGEVGLGQLFRYLDKLPSFSLLDAGYSSDGSLWRIYELECSELVCHIEERFSPNMWNIQRED